jgi:hypothetical protein
VVPLAAAAAEDQAEPPLVQQLLLDNTVVVVHTRLVVTVLYELSGALVNHFHQMQHNIKIKGNKQ